MNAKERRASIRQVERGVERLVRQGWKVEQIQHTDEQGEPLRTVVHLARDGSSIGDTPL